MEYTVSRLGLNLGTFPSREQALAFVCKHENANPLHLMSDYCIEARQTVRPSW